MPDLSRFDASSLIYVGLFSYVHVLHGYEGPDLRYTVRTHQNEECPWTRSWAFEWMDSMSSRVDALNRQ